MEIGKVSNEILQSVIFNNIKHKRDEVLVRPNIGEDCSILKFDKDEMIALSTDPITGATKNIGNLAVHVSCNDVSTSGAEPVGVLLTILLPPKTSVEAFNEIMDDIFETSKESNIEILGGHTEVTDAVTRVVVSTTVIGKVKKENMIATKGAELGQDIILTKWAGLEGTSILANEFEFKLKERLGEELVNNAKDLAKYLSVVPDSKVASKCNITSMHDVTEGGVLGAVWEVAKSSNLGVEINLGKIPVLKETKAICEVFNISPYYLISSGCMIMTTFESRKCIKELGKLGIEGNVIGEVTNKGKYIFKEDKKSEINPPESDELYKALSVKL